MKLVYGFLRQQWPDDEGGVNEKAAARALAYADNPSHWNPGSQMERWRTRVRDLVKRGETSGTVALVNAKVLSEVVGAICKTSPDGAAWFEECLKTYVDGEQRKLAGEWGLSDWQIWKLRFRSFPELDANEKALDLLLAWLKEAVDQYGSQAARGGLRWAIERVQPLWARLSDGEQRETLAQALKESSGWLSWDAKIARRESIVAKRRYGEPTPEEFADLEKEEIEAFIAVHGGAELPARRGDGALTWPELFASETDVPQEEVEP